jgi:hypothetical protein
MSLTVDDLVSSLSSSHIGQEAIELAALQEYLRQTGFGKPGAVTCPSPSFASPPSTSRQTLDQLCNTPISHNTPVQSSMAQYAWTERTGDGNSMTVNGESGDSSSCSALFLGGDDYSDEAMVEDLLIPSSPPPSSAFPQTRLRSSSSSSFVSSDPFYLAQAQTQLQATSTNWSEIQHSSFYSQQQSHGHTHNSGAFFATSSTPGPGYDSSLPMPGPMNSGYGQQQYEYYHHGQQQHRPPLAIDTHCMLVETCAAFAS